MGPLGCVDYLHAHRKYTRQMLARAKNHKILETFEIPIMLSRPLVGNLHAVDEWIDISSMVDLYRIYEGSLSEKLL